MDKILDIIELIAYEKGLQIEVVQNIIKNEILKLAKNIDPNKEYVTQIDKKDKTIKLFYKLKIVDEDTQDLDSSRFINIKQAKDISHNSEIIIGDELLVELNIDNLNLSRSSISNLFKDLENSIEKNIENQIFDNLKGSVGKIVNGVVISVDKNSEDTIIELDSVRARLSRKNRIKGEKFNIGQNVSCILKNIYIDKKYGLQIELSRTSPKFLEELLRLEVPEINDGEVEIIKSARLPGIRAKVAVHSNISKIDAVGATVGVKGVRINEIGKKIFGESIDVIEYCDVKEKFIANSLSPAKVVSIKIEDDTKATISLYSDQKARAIGKSGVNIRLASMLLGMNLEIIDLGSNPTLENSRDTINNNGKELLESLFKS